MSSRSRRHHLRPVRKPSLRPILEDLEKRTLLASSSITLPIVIHGHISMPFPTGSTSGSGGSAEPQVSGGPGGYSPSQIRTAYGLNNITFGTVTGDGSGQTIAIVDAYDDPAFVSSTDPNFSSSDLAIFDQTFGLPDPPSFTKYNQNGQTTNLPGTDPAAGSGNGDWEMEEALDIEWAHAMAPGASIDLIEASSDSDPNNVDLFTAVATAASLPGVSVVSMSWGLNEISSELSNDSTFVTPSGHQGVTFIAASGDSGSPGYYPAYSPNVLATGGTTLHLNANNTIQSETAWSGSGGGTSQFEPEPVYQDGVQSTGKRTIPDVAWNADPNTGVAVYDSFDQTQDGSAGWIPIGGTSVAAPSWSGLIAIANQGRVLAGASSLDGPSQTLPALYTVSSNDFNDITSGSNGGFTAGSGYDEVTGLGSPKANLLVPDLVAYGAATQMVVTAQPPEQRHRRRLVRGRGLRGERPGWRGSRLQRHHDHRAGEQPHWRDPRRYAHGDGQPRAGGLRRSDTQPAWHGLHVPDYGFRLLLGHDRRGQRRRQSDARLGDVLPGADRCRTTRGDQRGREQQRREQHDRAVDGDLRPHRYDSRPDRDPEQLGLAEQDPDDRRPGGDRARSSSRD